MHVPESSRALVPKATMTETSCPARQTLASGVDQTWSGHDPQFGYTSMPWPGYHVGYAIGDVFGLKNFDALIEGSDTGPPLA